MLARPSIKTNAESKPDWLKRPDLNADKKSVQKGSANANHHFSDIAVYPGSPAVVQPKLQVGKSGSMHEQQADAMADMIMQTKDHANQVSVSSAITGLAQSKNETDGTPINPVLNNKITASQGKGNDIDSNTQSFMSYRFDTDFSNVKIHTDSEAAGMNSELGARAFTSGNDIYFNEDEYKPGSAKGDHLLAHELTHVVQQSTGNKSIQKDDVDEQKAAAEEATRKADLVTKIQTYGIVSVEDADASFTSAELDLVSKALAGLPVSDQAAIKGVKLIRVISVAPNEARYTNTQGYEGTTITDEQKIEISNKAFGASTDETIRLITHEIAHAIAAMPYRLAMSEQIKEGAKSNQLIDESNAAGDEFDTANDENNTAIEESNAAIGVYNDAIKGTDADAIAAAKAEVAQKREVDGRLTAERAAKEKGYNTKKAAADAQKLVVTTKETTTKSKIANIDSLKRDAAAKLTAMNGAYTAADKAINMDDAESADYRTSLTAAEDAIKKFYDENALVDVEEDVADAAKSIVDSAIDDRNSKRDALNQLNPQNAVVSATAALETAQDKFFKAAIVVAFNKDMNLSVRKFYDLIIKNGISPALTTYAEENWPHKPEEFYAEAYSFFVTKPKDLETYSKVLYDWFKAGSYK